MDYWFRMFKVDLNNSELAEKQIIEVVTNKIMNKGRIMPGVNYILSFFKEMNFKIGIASSSPKELINIVIQMANIEDYIHAVSSAQ